MRLLHRLGSRSGIGILGGLVVLAVVTAGVSELIGRTSPSGANTAAVEAGVPVQAASYHLPASHRVVGQRQPPCDCLVSSERPTGRPMMEGVR